MDQQDLIAGLSARLDNRVTAAVRTGGHEDEYPVPAVIITDWELEDLTPHNTTFAGDEYADVDGDGTKEYRRFHVYEWESWVEISVRHHDEVDAARLASTVKAELRAIQDDPYGFHGDLKACRPRTSGSPSHQFVEPKETTHLVTAEFRGDHLRVDDTRDAIEQVKHDIQYTETP